MVVRVLSLCAGIGGLDRGISLALEGRSQTVCYVEREAYCAAVLVARMEEAALDPAPIWDDLSTFDGRPWRGRVDLVSGGYPCQPFSLAGSRQGADDPRHLWPDVKRIVAEIAPRWCFFENVAGHVSLGLENVVRDLEGMGYRVAATLVQAAEVGAPHRRERVFILGELAGGPGEQGFPSGLEREARPLISGRDESLMPSGLHLEHSASERRREGRTESAVRDGRDPAATGAGSAVADSQRDLLRHEPRRSGGPNGAGTGEPRHAGEGVADADVGRRQGVGRGGRCEEDAPAQRPGHVFPPGPGDVDAWRSLPEEAQPAIRRVADGPPLWLGTARADRLRALGNAVVPQQAALALRILIEALS